MEGLRKLYRGDFNSADWEWQDDGTVIITLVKDNDNVHYRFRVRDPFGEREELLSHEVIEHKLPPWIAQRIKEAQEHAAEG